MLNYGRTLDRLPYIRNAVYSYIYRINPICKLFARLTAQIPS